MKTILTLSLLILINFTANANASSADATNFIKAKQARAQMLNKEANQRVDYLRSNRGTANVQAGINTQTITEIEPAAGSKIDSIPESKTPAVIPAPASNPAPAAKDAAPAKLNNTITRASGVI